ncbi:hypothetical protein POM88_051876 [Heracleum sosnowskyi]|uniref:Fatty acid desaturase domain-containing protein n=1 Tax=Heracleum sosnowskyi TaxID=360622 RepID=A0AAD8GS00_9APIA|nr:hypothetical protein POM88_051876 [Heracleum sosnowskyi]
MLTSSILQEMSAGGRMSIDPMDMKAYGLYGLVVAKGLAWVLTHPALPHYNSSEWDWLRGALATVDRNNGILHKIMHNITDTHVVHHLFSTMPHYYAMEATKAIRPILGDYHAMWREAKECIYVEPDESGKYKGVFWYNNKL